VGKDIDRPHFIRRGEGVSKVNLQPLVILKDKSGELYLSIWTGLLEANVMLVVLEEVSLPRPLTADLTCDIMDKTGGKVDFVVIDGLENQTFYASVILRAIWTKIMIDARPSDTIAIALRTGAPIYAAPAVLDKAGVTPFQKTDEFTTVSFDS